MEGNRKNLGSARNPHEGLKEDLEEGEEDSEDSESPPEENTNPGLDQEVQNALASLHRIQVATRVRASDVEELLVRRKTPFPR